MAEIKIYRWPWGKVHAVRAFGDLAEFGLREPACTWAVSLQVETIEDGDDSQVTCKTCLRVLESEKRRKKS